MNCEDIAFSFMVANITRAPGVFVSARVKNVLSDNAISAKRGHGTARYVDWHILLCNLKLTLKLTGMFVLRSSRESLEVPFSRCLFRSPKFPPVACLSSV